MKFSSAKAAEAYYNEVKKRLNKKLSQEFSPKEIEELSLMDMEFLKQMIINEIEKERSGTTQTVYQYNKDTGQYEEVSHAPDS
jgi:hypothetical protein